MCKQSQNLLFPLDKCIWCICSEPIQLCPALHVRTQSISFPFLDTNCLGALLDTNCPWCPWCSLRADVGVSHENANALYACTVLGHNIHNLGTLSKF